MTIYFYKVDQPYGYFSNFSLHPICLASPTGQDWWPTVEHYYQAHKFLGGEFAYLMAKIQVADTPEAAAAIGRFPTHLPSNDWSDRKLAVMFTAVRQKFYSYDELRALLLATGETEIIENSPVDSFWGCGADRSGHNHLGQIIMEIRQEIRQATVTNT
jgi:N-glycosidase YbiA